jgi:D-alanyl-D-alanine carboxypeptidase
MKIFVTTLLILIVFKNSNAQQILFFADSLLLTNQIPELGFAVITKDSVLELRTLGYHRADIKNEKTKANLDDYFHLGSNTKAITGFVAAYLVESKKINWETKFFDLFPTWKKSSNPAYYEITLADLLSHRARIEPYTSGLEYQELPDFKGNKSEQRKQFAKYLLIEKPVKTTDKLYNYSNAGYSIASLMLEKVSGISWEQLTKKTLLKLLNVNVEFGFPNRLNSAQTYGHRIQNDSLKVVESNDDYNLALGEPAGDISMTLPDYVKFIQCNLKGLLGQDNILKATTYDYLHFGIKDYSIGWGNVNKADKQFSEHAGSAGTFFCYTLLDKKKNLAYIIIANSSTKQAQQGIFKLLDRLKKLYGS